MMITGILALPRRGDEAPLLLCEGEPPNMCGVCISLRGILMEEVLEPPEAVRDVICD